MSMSISISISIQRNGGLSAEQPNILEAGGGAYFNTRVPAQQPAFATRSYIWSNVFSTSTCNAELR